MEYRDDILICLQGAGFQSVEYTAGILKALEDKGIKPGKAMTSSGSSLAMALYYSKGLDFIYEVMSKSTPSDFIDIKMIKLAQEVVNLNNHFIDTDPLRKLLEENMTAEATKRLLTGITRLRDFKNFMVPATPATVLAATAIEAVMTPVEINGELYGDSGLLNNTPTPSYFEARQYKHIFLGVGPEPKFDNDPRDNIVKFLINLVLAIAYREVHQVKESGFCELPNVTFIQPPEELGSGLLNWSPDFQFREAVRQQMEELLNGLDL